MGRKRTTSRQSGEKSKSDKKPKQVAILADVVEKARRYDVLKELVDDGHEVLKEIFEDEGWVEELMPSPRLELCRNQLDPQLTGPICGLIKGHVCPHQGYYKGQIRTWK